jgi:hypothetical protein
MGDFLARRRKNPQLNPQNPTSLTLHQSRPGGNQNHAPGHFKVINNLIK